MSPWEPNSKHDSIWHKWFRCDRGLVGVTPWLIANSCWGRYGPSDWWRQITGQVLWWPPPLWEVKKTRLAFVSVPVNTCCCHGTRWYVFCNTFLLYILEIYWNIFTKSRSLEGIKHVFFKYVFSRKLYFSENAKLSDGEEDYGFIMADTLAVWLSSVIRVRDMSLRASVSLLHTRIKQALHVTHSGFLFHLTTWRSPLPCAVKDRQYQGYLLF